jgi:hypothetical protein
VGNPANVVHITLPGLLAYQTGLGVPDSAALVNLGIPSGKAKALVTGMIASGLNPTGTPLPGNMTLTADETTQISNAVTGFNQTITNLAATFVYTVVDVNSTLNDLNTLGGISGLSGMYVLLAPANTAFSLDGVHPSNAGQALIANEFIAAINQTLGLSISPLNLNQYIDQYTGKPLASEIHSSFDGVRKLFNR